MFSGLCAGVGCGTRVLRGAAPSRTASWGSRDGARYAHSGRARSRPAVCRLFVQCACRISALCTKARSAWAAWAWCQARPAVVDPDPGGPGPAVDGPSGGHMPAPGFAMRVGGAEGRFVWFQMRPLGARAPGALPPTVRGTLWALRAWLYAVYSNPQLLPAHIPEPR